MIDVKIDYETCENSEFCFEVCPEDVFEIKSQQVVVVRPESCTSCWLCVQNCPTGAVTIE
jgi:NAD-dependent dihydropyrimidine dehydrogenase PreA subunit